MNRSLAILLGALALAAALFAGGFFASQRATVMCCANPADDLGWLRAEFHLSDADMTRIRQLHEGYKPQCAEICARIAEQNRELQTLLGPGTNLTAAARAKLNEIAQLRAQCQAQMFQHFIAVSQAMPPAQGRRYLAEMKQLTFGGHEQMEQAMSDMPGMSGGPAHEQAH